MIRKALILAGGLGTRLRKTVPNLPKPMAPLNGRPFLEYQMDYCISQGIDEFFISVGYLNEKIVNHFGTIYKNKRINYIFEDKQLGTGGAILKSEKFINEDFIILNGDTYFEIDFSILEREHINTGSKFTLALFKNKINSRYLGIELSNRNKVINLNKSSSCLSNGGVYIVDKSIFHDLDLELDKFISLEEDIFPVLIDRKTPFYGKLFSDFFIDIGIPEDYNKAKKYLKNSHSC